MRTDDIRDRAFAYVMRHDMLKQNERVVVGISGGADSMCLLGLLLEWRGILNLDITVLHVNHGIRGAAADEDESFVREFCRKMNVTFRSIHADVPKLARESGTTEEEAGRNLRYRVFLETAEELGCNRIAIAHNRSDNAETVIFNILRGSGIAGLKGISPVRRIKDGITVIRPLLDTSREDIESWLADHSMTFRTDATNFDTGYSRNAIRNIAMPLFKERINSASEEHIVRLAAQAAQIEEFLSAQADGKLHDDQLLTYEDNRNSRSCNSINDRQEAGKRLTGEKRPDLSNGDIFTCRINISALEQSDPLIQGMIVRRVIGELSGGLKDITNVHVDDVLSLKLKQTGRKVDLPYGITARRGYGEIILEKGSETCGKNEKYASFDEEIAYLEKNIIKKFTEASPYTVRIPDGNASDTAVLRLFVTDSIPDGDFTKNLYTKCFDCDKIIDGISIRTRRTGDYLLLRGRDGGTVRKSLKTWMIDNKIPAGERDRIVIAAEGRHVLWVVGHRRDDSCFVDENTRKVLILTLEVGHE